MGLPSAILLDLDDTIVAFDAVADDCWRSTCARYSRETGITAEELFTAVSRSRAWFWSDMDRHRSGRADLEKARRQIVKRAFTELKLDCQDVAVRLADDFTQERERLVTPFPGAIETLEELKLRGILLALITNGEARGQRSKIERFDLFRHFDCILIEGEFGVGKPNLSVFTHVLGVLGRSPQDTWMVGDSLTFDIAPAMDLGIFSVWIDRTRAGLPTTAPCKPDRIIKSLVEIIDND